MQHTSHINQCFYSIVCALHDEKTDIAISIPTKTQDKHLYQITELY